ncbi:MAG: DUF420 domain-containing protein [Acidobacteriota bacterium]
MDLPFFPPLNACLNAASAVQLLCGLACIRAGKRAAHKRFMLGAVATTILFLACYVTYHLGHGTTRFAHQGPIRTVYFTILTTHTFLAASLVGLVPVTLRRALRDRFDAHKRLARVTFPIWLYVSITGVVIYFMLYRL